MPIRKIEYRHLFSVRHYIFHRKMVRVKAIPKKSQGFEEYVRDLIAKRHLQWDEFAIWFLSAKALRKQQELKQEAELCASIEGVKVSAKHWLLAAKIRNIEA